MPGTAIKPRGRGFELLLLGEQISLMLGLGLMAIIIGVAAINLGQGPRQ